MLRDLWRYPVKSVQGEQLPEAAVDDWGIAGDREYGLRDVETGKVVSAKQPKRYPGVLHCRAELDGPNGSGSLRVTLPDGEVIDEHRVGPRLSALTGRRLELTRAAAPGSAAERLKLEDLDPDAAVEVLGSPEEATRHLVRDFELAAAARPGSFFDFAPIHLVSTSTLARLAALEPGLTWSARRFRPNLVVDDGGRPDRFGEDAWLGRDILIGGEVRLRPASATPRCVVVTLPQPGLEHEPGILRAVAGHHRLAARGFGPSACVGMYAEVVRGGSIRAGDSVRLVPAEGRGPGAVARALALRAER